MGEATPHPFDIEHVFKKRLHFDRAGVEDTLATLCAMDGYFDLEDVIDRLPFGEDLLKRWHSDPNSKLRGCFAKIQVGKVKSRIYINLFAFNRQVKKLVS